MKKLLTLSAIFLFFSLSCKKNENETSKLSLNQLQVNRANIASMIKTQLDSSKTLVALTAKTGYIKNTELQSTTTGEQRVVTVNMRPIKDYYNNYFKTSGGITSTSTIKTNMLDSGDGSYPDILNITSDYQSPYYPGINLNNIANSYIISDEIPYQNQYLSITESYSNLADYTSQLSDLENTIYTSQASDDTKISLTFQIELLKLAANDIENNLSYYEDLITNSPTYGGTQSISNLTLNSQGLKVNRLASCHVDTGSVLRGAIVGGFAAGVSGAYTGATAGTVTFPGIGTVTGGVSGFMGGFAVGFIGGVVTGTIAELLGSCFH
jgi:hypothetical protein